ncbi:MAG: hypothetical protein N0E48_12165 [Candidatus Thiodiazotropha endolucinida]|nr:hypothetical protein [Candidatus Thiodiazotropha taylori]MCW4344096.1 hypothetical protein [Candidatus Thiodiazotropha endolucinida]
MINLVKRLPDRAALPKEGVSNSEIGIYNPEDHDEVVINPCFLLHHRRAFIERAVQHQWSAQQYWAREGEVDVSYPVWLQWIYNELNGESNFNMKLSTLEDGEVTGNILISDLTIAPEKDATE